MLGYKHLSIIETPMWRVMGGRILQPEHISFKQTTSKQDIEDIQILLRAILRFKL
jgi:hypothetical protein